ncbi:retrovirus-related pol polyprotein from transposon TNT 1-94, partial [Tanacetum coccineum]
ADTPYLLDGYNVLNVRSVVTLFDVINTPPLTAMSLITSKERHIREPIWYLDSGCSRSMTGVKSYLYKYVEKPGLKVVFGDNSSCITEGYGSINSRNNLQCYQKIVLIAPRRNDVYVLDISSLTPNGACFFAKASESVIGYVYSKDKPCSTCEKGKHHRASIKTKQNFSIRKCLHLFHMDLFGPVSPMSINHEKYTLVIVDECSRMVENQNDVKVKQIRTDNGTEFRNHELETKRKNKTLIEVAKTMLNGSVLSKHFWTEAVRITCYTQNRSIIIKRYDKTPYEIFRERILDISYFHVFGCPMFIHNHKDHLGKFDVKANDSMEAIGFTNTSEDEIRIDDSSRYPLDEFIHKDDPSRQYQTDSDISYYVIPHGRSLSELTQENHVPEVIAPNEPDIPLTEDTEGPPDLINTEGTHEQNVQNEQIITQPTEGPLGNNTEVSISINESL